MRLLVATHATQGTRRSDLDLARDGEIVKWPTFECADEPADGPCGCQRALAGLDSGMYTTTMQMVDVPLSRAELVERLVRSLARDRQVAPKDLSVEDRWSVEMEVEAMLDRGNDFPTGAIVERRQKQIFLRAAPGVHRLVAPRL